MGTTTTTTNAATVDVDTNAVQIIDHNRLSSSLTNSNNNYTINSATTNTVLHGHHARYLVATNNGHNHNHHQQQQQQQQNQSSLLIAIVNNGNSDTGSLDNLHKSNKTVKNDDKQHNDDMSNATYRVVMPASLTTRSRLVTSRMTPKKTVCLKLNMPDKVSCLCHNSTNQHQTFLATNNSQKL